MTFRSYHTLNKPDFEESGAPQYYTELGLELHRSTFRGPVNRTTEHNKRHVIIVFDNRGRLNYMWLEANLI